MQSLAEAPALKFPSDCGQSSAARVKLAPPAPPGSEADAYACDLLIPPADYEHFCASEDFSLAAIRRFASRMGIVRHRRRALDRCRVSLLSP